MNEECHSLKNERRRVLWSGWIVGFFSTLIYLMTLSPTVSFWDCGEFIATSYTFGVGHPPGAPLYQLLAHLFTLIPSHPDRIALWSNMLSALSGGFCSMFLFWSIFRIAKQIAHERLSLNLLAAGVGALCYSFCDTAWFSAVESEVYGLAMLLSSVIVWATIRWYDARKERAVGSSRWIVLVALLLGLSFCVHEMCWLTVPFVVVVLMIALWKEAKGERLFTKRRLGVVALCLGFFLLGTTPYLIIPLRAQSNPSINNGDPSTAESFKRYLAREQYENGPALYPRIWRRHKNDMTFYADWSGMHGTGRTADGQTTFKPNFLDNAQFFASYQLWYMYFRYLMWNFAGRFDDSQGYGTLQHGQFVTGLRPIDHFLVGTGKYPPDSLPNASHNVYFLLPLLLGVWGMCYQYRRDRRQFWATLALFLFSGVGLAVYLNMPVYQPRERDYAFVLSFFAFAVWIGLGACAFGEWLAQMQARHRTSKILQQRWLPALLLLVPLWMLVENYDDHDRSDNYIARDTARNMLMSCDKDAILFTIGDNDTFPLWYVQEVEGFRKDVRVVNLSLLTTYWYASQKAPECRRDGEQQRGMNAFLTLLEKEERVYFSHYGYNDYKQYFGPYMSLTGICYKLDMKAFTTMAPCDSVDCDEAARHILDDMSWEVPATRRVGCDATSQKFLNQYVKDALLVAENLIGRGELQTAGQVLAKVRREIPEHKISDLALRYRFYSLAENAGTFSSEEIAQGKKAVKDCLEEQLSYYHSLPKHHQTHISYTLSPLEDLASVLCQ